MRLTVPLAVLSGVLLLLLVAVSGVWVSLVPVLLLLLAMGRRVVRLTRRLGVLLAVLRVMWGLLCVLLCAWFWPRPSLLLVPLLLALWCWALGCSLLSIILLVLLVPLVAVLPVLLPILLAVLLAVLLTMMWLTEVWWWLPVLLLVGGLVLVLIWVVVRMLLLALVLAACLPLLLLRVLLLPGKEGG